MGHYAKLDENNIVLEVNVVDDEQEETLGGESATVEWLKTHWGGADWKKCSYNTIRNQHRYGGTPFRGNYPGQGYIYSPELDAFYSPPWHECMVFDESVMDWEEPTPPPDDENEYYFDGDRWDPDTPHSGWFRVREE